MSISTHYKRIQGQRVMRFLSLIPFVIVSTNASACWPLIKPAYFIVCGQQQIAGTVETVSESAFDILSGKIVTEIRIRVTEKWGMNIGPYLKVRVFQSALQDRNTEKTGNLSGALKLVGGCHQRPILVNDEIIVAPASQPHHPDKTVIYAEVNQVQDFGGTSSKSSWRKDIAQKSSCKDPSIKWSN